MSKKAIKNDECGKILTYRSIVSICILRPILGLELGSRKVSGMVKS